jgi:hypothetical protein
MHDISEARNVELGQGASIAQRMQELFLGDSRACALARRGHFDYNMEKAPGFGRALIGQRPYVGNGRLLRWLQNTPRAQRVSFAEGLAIIRGEAGK